MVHWTAKWDLSRIYHGFSDRTFQEALAVCRAEFAALREELRDPLRLTPEETAALLRRYDAVCLHLSTPEAWHAMWSAVHLPSGESGAAGLRLEELRRQKQAVFSLLEKALDRLAAEDPGQEALSRAGLEPWRFLMQESRRLAPHRPSPETAELMDLMRENGSRAWYALRNELDAAASVPVPLPEGVLSLSEVRGLQASPEAEIRRLAYEAELRAYPGWEIPMAACLNGIKGEALAELPMKGYASVREEMLDVNKMSGRTLDTLHAAIEEHLPALREYLRTKARILGHTDGLPWYDLAAPVGVPTGGISLEEARDRVLTVLNGFYAPLGDLARRAFDEGWIDALPRAGKQSGGICYDLPELRENRILVNYDGSVRSVLTLAHELGHAWHNRCLDQTPFCLRDVPTPICETASIFNETLMSEALLTEGGAPRLSLLDTELSGIVQTVMDIYSRYLFEDALFACRADHRLRPEEIRSLMTEAQRTVFGDCLDPDYLHPWMWMCKVHYYIPGFHYYNYPYYFGLLFSRGLFSLYRREGEAFPARYRKLLAESGSARLEEIAAFVGADIGDRAFWDEALSGIDRLCAEFCSLSGSHTG